MSTEKEALPPTSANKRRHDITTSYYQYGTATLIAPYQDSTATLIAPSEEGVSLSTLSPKDKPWNVHRANSDRVKNLYESTELERYGNRIRDCSQMLQFAALETEEGNLGLKLHMTHFCRVRTCPTCQWRRSLMWRARFFRAIPKVFEVHPDARFVLLTLTQRDCALTDLRATLQVMNKGWERLSKRKQFTAIGWVKSVEVTRGQDGTAHPHFHVLLMVKPSYFKKNYLSQATWTELWAKSLRIDYTPVVDVRSVRARPGHEGELGGGMAAGVLETLKYGVKESDLIADRGWLIELTKQLHKTRAVAVGGVLREFIREEEPDDLIHTEDSDSVDVIEEAPKFFFGWRERLEQYVYVD